MFIACLSLKKIFSKNVSVPLLFSIIILFGAPDARAGEVTRQSKCIVLGDYDKEPRIGPHVDAKFLAKRLVELGANTYMWLIGHNKNDWPDLVEFLPIARKNKITVWVYLLPPSETPAQAAKFQYSEPYRLDYITWAKQIALLSLKNSNLKGYVIDDFWRNVVPDKKIHSNRFTVSYVKEFIQAGKSINPNLKFYPLMYFTDQMINEKFADSWLPLVDGVVAAYPLDQTQVIRAVSYLNKSRGSTVPMIVMVSGDGPELEKFNHVDGTPENIASGVSSMIELAHRGVTQGVVTYRLNKNIGSKEYDAVKALYLTSCERH